MWLAAAGMSAGAATGPRIGVAAGLITALCGSIALATPSRSRVAIVGLVLVTIGLGASHAALRAHRPLADLAAAIPRCDVSGVVLEEAGALGTMVAVEATSCAFAAGGAHGIALVDQVNAEPGSSFIGRAWILPLSSDGFDAVKRRAGAHATLDPTAIAVTAPRSPWHRMTATIRDRLRSATAALRRETAGLLRGLSIGDTDAIDPATLEMFRRSGLSHLLAVSGSNVALVVGAGLLLARRLALRVRIAIAAGMLVTFVGVVGPDPSVLRAAAMGGLSLAALATGRVAQPLAVLGVAVLVLVGLRPQTVFSAGMHLSVAATAGIVVLGARFHAAIAPLPRAVGGVLAVTLAAQVAVAPVLIATFGEISVVSPIANLIAAPAVAPATILVIIAGIVELVYPPAARIVALLAAPFGDWILFVGRRFGVPSWAAVEISPWLALPAAVGVGIALRARLRLTSMAGFVWVTHDRDGNEIARSDTFDSKETAEAWMGTEWAGLRANGGETVTLFEGDEQHYRMGLGEA